MVVLIPLFGFIYKNYFRMTLLSTFLFIGVAGSVAPILFITISADPQIDAYAGFLNESYEKILTKIYYRLPPFLIGIALAIFNFEYKHVNRLNDGSKPFHKDIIDKWAQKKNLFKIVIYSVGIVASFLMLVLLWVNA